MTPLSKSTCWMRICCWRSLAGLGNAATHSGEKGGEKGRTYRRHPRIRRRRRWVTRVRAVELVQNIALLRIRSGINEARCIDPTILILTANDRASLRRVRPLDRSRRSRTHAAAIRRPCIRGRVEVHDEAAVGLCTIVPVSEMRREACETEKEKEKRGRYERVG